MRTLVELVEVCGVYLIPIIAILGGLSIAALKILKDGPSKASEKDQADEARLIQQIHQGLLKMEKRIETLETILLDRGGKHKTYRETDSE